MAEINHEVVGTFIIKDNFPGLGSHVANASYMTLPVAFGKGIGRSMAEFSLTEAKHLGYRAMQFNIVVKTNDRAIRLWQKLGFEIKAEIPMLTSCGKDYKADFRSCDIFLVSFSNSLRNSFCSSRVKSLSTDFI